MILFCSSVSYLSIMRIIIITLFYLSSLLLFFPSNSSSFLCFLLVFPLLLSFSSFTSRSSYLIYPLFPSISSLSGCHDFHRSSLSLPWHVQLVSFIYTTSHSIEIKYWRHSYDQCVEVRIDYLLLFVTCLSLQPLS